MTVGGGTRLKILEAMALGTPVVSTSKGAEGLEVTPKEDILIVDDTEGFAEAVTRVMEDEALREHLTENGRRLVREKYDWEAIGENLNHFLERIAAGRRAC
jgi:glycosyltransferase involved in cell wall biosynthesis